MMDGVWKAPSCWAGERFSIGGVWLRVVEGERGGGYSTVDLSMPLLGGRGLVGWEGEEGLLFDTVVTQDTLSI